MLLVWDKEGAPPVGDWTAVLWRSLGESAYPDAISIPVLVEEHADTLRARYLAWIFELGETRINGKRLVDHLELRAGLSYWWITLLTEKSYAKSPQIFDVVRLFVLEDLTQSLSSQRIKLVSNNYVLANAFQCLCRNAKIEFDWQRSEQADSQISSGMWSFRLLPYMAQAAIYLARYLWQRWPPHQKRTRTDITKTASITFVDYLAHLNHSTITTGCFASNYWTELTGALTQAKSQVNWLHLYVKNEAVPTAVRARDLIARFNRNGSKLESHTSLDGALNFPLLFTILRDYARLVWKSWQLGRIRSLFRPHGSNLDFGLLFKQDWLNSMRGPAAMWNCIALNLFEKTLCQLPCQKLGVYLQENQGWEAAFIHAWKAAGHGHLIGVPHTTVRYWDLRYFFDPRCYTRTVKNDLPMPDQVALNGSAAIKAYHNGGYPKNQIIEVEALRYLYLTAKKDKKGTCTNSSRFLKILVCGDILPAVNKQMMRWLEVAASNLPTDTHYFIKPHPACSIEASHYPALTLNMTNAPLVELLADCDVVFASNITSAVVDAYLSAIPVIQVLDGNTFNMSPLRSLKGVMYVTNPSELAAALMGTKERDQILAGDYFCLDNELPRWRKLLGLR